MKISIGQLPENTTTIVPATLQQQGIWFHAATGGTAYWNFTEKRSYTGELQVPLLKKALEELVNRHSSLRTNFRIVGNSLFQFIRENIPVNEYFSWHQFDPEAPDLMLSKIQEIAYKDEQFAFNYESDTLLRCTVVSFKKVHCIVLTVNHIITDSMSMQVCWNELIHIYNNLRCNKEISLTPATPYSRYATWQKDFAGTAAFEKQRQYWTNRLSREWQALDFSLHNNSAHPVIIAHEMEIPQRWIEQIRTFSLRKKVLYSSVFQLAYFIFLHKYSGSTRICISNVVNGRGFGKQSYAGVVGLFATRLINIQQLTGEITVGELLNAVNKDLLDSFANSDFPYEELARMMSRQQGSGSAALLQVYFNMIKAGGVTACFDGLQEYDGIGFRNAQVGDQQYALGLSVIDRGNSVKLAMNIRCDAAFEPFTRFFLESYWNILQACVHDPTQSITSIHERSKEEYTLLKRFNDTTIVYPREETLPALFIKQALQTPTAVALVFETQQFTYAALNERSNQLAHFLHRKGVQRESLVAVCMQRNPEIIIAMLAILKAGGAYVPVDPAYPAERIRHMLEDTDPVLILCCPDTASLIPGAYEKKITVPDIRWFAGNPLPVDPLPIEVVPQQLAYVIFTSGSTGKPKGVMVEHKGLTNLLYWHNHQFEVSAASKATAVASVGFDAFGWEVWPYLIKGATVHLINEQLRYDPSALLCYCRKENITHAFIPTPLIPSFLEVAAYEITALQFVLTGGDRLHVKKEQSCSFRLINNYGPTENTVVATSGEVQLPLQHPAPLIGKPIHNNRIYIVNANGKLCSAGMPGELCIGGDNLARGYLRQETLTAEKFIEFCDGQGNRERIYRTGDRARWTADGRLEYLGRLDDQIKIRGFRIEPGEIETVLEKHPLVKQAVIGVKEDERGHKRLIAYLLTLEPTGSAKLRSWLAGWLPDYMIPTAWVFPDRFPVTHNGKVDRHSLPTTISREEHNHYVAPRNEIEWTIASIWQRLFNMNRVGIQDNFFALGGDSIITIQVASRLRKEGYDCRPGDIFSFPTIAQLSSHIAKRNKSGITAEQGLLTGACGLLPIQQWYLHKEAGNPAISHFNQHVLLSINKKVGPDELSIALQALIAQHDTLRFHYQSTKDGRQQTYGPQTVFFSVCDLQHIAPALLSGQIMATVNAAQETLDIENGMMARCLLLLTPQGEDYNRFFMVIHHLAVDIVSWQIILEDLETLLLQVQQNKKPQTGPKSSSYRNWQKALETYSKSNRLLKQQNYWESIAQHQHQLPTDKTIDSLLQGWDTVVVQLPEEKTKQLLTGTSTAYHTNVNDLLLVALWKTLYAWTGSTRQLIGFEGHGREETITHSIDLSRTVGWFTSLYPVLLQVDEQPTYEHCIKSIKEALRSIPDKGIGYGVLTWLNKGKEARKQHPWQLVFNYMGQTDNTISSSEWFHSCVEEAGNRISPHHTTEENISINSWVTGGKLQVHWGYKTGLYLRTTIEHLATHFSRELTELITHCLETINNVNKYTPADYGLAGAITWQELDELQLPHHQVEWIGRLSALQEGMLFHSLYHSDVKAYTEQFNAVLSNVQPALLCSAWEILLRRHSILRTAFYHKGINIPLQCVFREVTLPVEMLDYRQLPGTEQQSAIRAFEEKDRALPFHFTKPPLMRLGLIRTTDDCYRMVWTLHHILLDGWSIAVLMNELQVVYESLINNLPAEPDDRPVDHYSDLIRFIETRDHEEEETFWRSYLSGLQRPTLLPFVNHTSERTKGLGEYDFTRLVLDTDLTKKINRYAQESQVTVNTLMQGVWSYLLYRYTGEQEVVFGVTVSGRPDEMANVESKVGLYINTLPLHASIRKDQLMTHWLKAIQSSQVACRQHQHSRLNDLQQMTGIPGDWFDSLLVFENYPVIKENTTNPWKLQVEGVSMHEQTNYPLTINISGSETLQLIFSYNTTLLEAGYVDQISRHFREVLSQLVSAAVEQAGNLEISSNTHNSYYEVNSVPEKTLVHLFEEQAALDPSRTAIVGAGRRLTWQELDQRANQLAHHLRKAGVQAETLVALCTGRDPHMLTAIMGILKAGGAYVPIDPEYPATRIDYLLSDTSAAFLLVTEETQSKVPENYSGKTILLNSAWDQFREEPDTTTGVHIDPQQLAYVLYTSGSTGKPKGVMIEHRNVMTLLQGFQQVAPAEKESAGLSVCPFVFDVSVWEFFINLCFGNTLHLVPTELAFDPPALIAYLDAHNITTAYFPPTILADLAQYLQEYHRPVPLKRLLVGVMPIKQGILQQIIDSIPALRIINGYGPTETTVCSTFYPFKKATALQKHTPIGKPVTGYALEIIDKNGHPAPAGVPGELYILGAGVGRGYWNNSVLTAEKFLQRNNGTTAYRTGDLVKTLPDGNIEYIGRMDEQVKIRGYRIEPGEVETVLQQSALIKQGVVVARPDSMGQQQLVAYLVPAANFDQATLHRQMLQQLPAYMVPTRWVLLETLPLTPSGKTDRAALPEPGEQQHLAYVPPRNETEALLTGIWQSLLSMQRISIHDNFFTLGGHSLLAMRVIAHLAKKIKGRFPVKIIFEHPTIAELAACIDAIVHNLAAATSNAGEMYEV